MSRELPGRKDLEPPQDHCLTCGAKLKEENRAFVDLDSNMALLDGKALRLTSAHAVVLYALLTISPRCATLGYIMDSLFGLESDEPGDKVVNVHIHKLRKQLKGTNYRIETLWGKGYRFVRIPEHERKEDVGAS